MKNASKYLCALLALTLMVATLAPLSTITASAEDDFIEIYTIDDLYAVRNDLSANYILMDDIDMTADTAAGGGWDFGGRGWNPIGGGNVYGGTAFTGIFEGNGHVITGMRINAVLFPTGTDQKNSYCGLFARNEGTIRNLGLRAATILSAAQYTGSIVAVNAGTISNCFTDCDITLGKEKSGDSHPFIGGFVARNTGSISDCVALGNVTDNSSCFSSGGSEYTYTTSYLRGFAGDEAGVIQNSYSMVVLRSRKAQHYTAYAFAEGKSLINCYYDDKVGGNRGEATPLTEAQMTFASSFAGFDFENTWVIYPDSAYRYPQLRSCPFDAENAVASLAVTTLPNKLTYAEGKDALSISGGKITVTFKDETTEEKAITREMVSGFDNTVAGVQTLTVTYGRNTATYRVTVTHNYKDVVTPATCTAGGYTTHTCATCGATQTDTPTAALGHNYAAVVTPPVCGAAGYTAHTCTRCGDSYVDTYVAALEHDYVAAVVPPTCTASGYTAHTCTHCGDSYRDAFVAAAGHTFGAWTQTKAPSCTAKGAEQRACSVCGEKETRDIAALGHDYAAVVTPPTCTAQGYTTHTCLRCGDAYTDTPTAMREHTFGDWGLTKAPSCTVKGEEARVCFACGAEETREVNALGHDYTAIVTPPTCTAQGYTTHTCTRCGDSYVDTPTAVREHVYGDWTQTKAPTCTEKGVEARVCSACGATQTRDVATAAHTYADSVVAPTCTENGYTLHTCTVCGDMYAGAYTVALGHDHSVDVRVEPTATEEGYIGHKCSRCDDLKIDTVLPVTAVDESDRQAVVESKRAKSGETVTLTVTLKNADPVRSMGASDIVYDADALTLTKVEWAAGSSLMKQWDDAKGKGALTVGSTPADVNGAVLTLTFAVKDTAAEGDYTVGLRFTVNAGGAANEAVPVLPGTLTVKNYTAGDLDGNEEITDDDAIYLLMYTFFPEDYPVDQPVDYNGDGEITDEDAIWLLMHTFFPEDYPIV